MERYWEPQGGYGLVDVVGLGVVLEMILKSALHTIDSIDM